MKSKMTFAGLIALGIALLITGCDDDCTDVRYVHSDPPVPSGVYTVTGDGAVQVYWSPIREADVERYGVYRSGEPDGRYDWIADVEATDDPFNIDRGLVNGVTYYYAVDSWSQYGESDLSYELIADTPRPEGDNLVLYHEEADPDRAGLDFSRITEPGADEDDMVRSWDHTWTDYYVILVDSLFRLVGTVVDDGGQDAFNLVQDFGYTYDFDEIGFAPDIDESYSFDPYGVELLFGHTYVFWTWDDHFAKLRVIGFGEEKVFFEWAYQTSMDEIERMQLAPGLVASTVSGAR